MDIIFWEIMAGIVGVMLWSAIILWALVFAIWTLQFIVSVVQWGVYKFYAWRYSQ